MGKQAIEFPTTPDKRVVEPAFPAYVATSDKVKIYGYIGTVTKTTVNLHHMFDHRAYYKIWKDGIKSCKLEASGKLEKLYELEIDVATPIRYFHTTTVELKAGALAQAVDFHNKYGKKNDHQDVREHACTHNCPPGCCLGDTCITVVDFPMGVGQADIFGLDVSTPTFPVPEPKP
jgi:hypothetical protein